MTRLFSFFLFFFISGFGLILSQGKSVIADHNCTKISLVPLNYIQKASLNLRIAYGHTSHGSQIVTGMSFLSSENPDFNFNNGNGSLYLNDATLLSGDLGNPDRTSWADRTRNMLNSNSQNINMVMWSWCGQVDGSESDINNYLNLMSKLEQDFPAVKFVYMTGHLNGTGINGNVNQRNEQIRNFCLKNDKILFDFADIESYDPDGNYFLDKSADDGCNYSGGNWADEWCAEHPGECIANCSCAHSKCLNCQQKGRVFWWMLAVIAGWEKPEGVANDNDILNIELSPNPASDYIIISLPSDAHTLKGVVEGVRLYDVFGQVYPTLALPASREGVRIDVSSLPAGVYFLRVGDKVSKFVKI